MKFKKYIYKGVNSAMTLKLPAETEGGAPTDLDVLLFNGKTVELPEDDEATKTLLLNGNLVLLDEPKKPVTNSTTAKGA